MNIHQQLLKYFTGVGAGG